MESILKRLAGIAFGVVLALGLMGCSGNVEEHEHTFATEWTSDATYHWHAATCEHTEEVSSKAPHTYGEWKDGLRICSTCDYEQTCEHTYSEWADGSRICSICDYEQTCEHTYGEWYITTQPTEEKVGAREHACEICGSTETEELAKLDHVHKLGTHHAAVPGTCRTKGIVEYYDCVKATCLVKLDKNVNPLDTTEGALDPANHEGTATTWTKTAATHKETYDCCDAVKTSEAAHTWNEGVVTKPSTEEAEGVKTFTCSVCKMTKTEAIAKLPHTHKYASAWTSDGSYHWHASTCGHPSEVSDKALHTWDAGVVTKAATEYAKGEKTYTCDVCSTTRTEVIPIWYESPVDVKTGNAATASSTYVYFGVFPRTVLPSNSTVTVDEDDKVKMGANTYFKGSDGEYYAKVLEDAYGTGEEYKYENGEQSKQESAGSYRYFKVEPIKWKVLTKDYNGTGNALLLAEDILTANVPYYRYNFSSSTRTVGTDTDIYPNNYKYSQIRAYLNGLDYYYDKRIRYTEKETDYTGKGFLQAAFTKAAQSKIVTTTVDNSAASTTDAGNHISQATSYACENTSDKIFLLSEKEVTNTAYGFAAYNSSRQGRVRMPTDYAKANCAFQESTTGCGGWWWLRSPTYDDSNVALLVGSSGYANGIGGYVNKARYGVVPALSISF